eukprot:15271481-Heterocapsa_arctica.AAC.1
MGIDKTSLERVVEAQHVSSSDFEQTYKRSGRNLLVIARMPGDRSKTVKHVKKPSNILTAIYTCMCTPLGRTA